MDEQPKEGASDRPGFFKSVNGWIAGITALVVALAGLATALHPWMSKEQKESTAAVATPNATDAEAAGAANMEAVENDDPWGYTTDARGTLRYKGGLWIETDSEGTETRYTPESVENGFTYARDKGAAPNGEDVFLRWPTAGGQVEKSVDRQVHWNDLYVVSAETAETTEAEAQAQ